MSEREAYWRGLLDEWRSSGVSRAAFCRRRGVSYHTLSQWKRRIEADRGGSLKRHGNSQPGRPRFVEVSVPSTTATYEITLAGGRSLRVSPGFDAGEVARLIAVVESC